MTDSDQPYCDFGDQDVILDEKHVFAAFGPPMNLGTNFQVPSRPARRFVRDGDVPVVVLTAPRNTSGSHPTENSAIKSPLEDRIKTERARRESAEREMRELSSMLQALRTQIGHLQLEHGEKTENLEKHIRKLQRLLNDEMVAKQALEARIEKLLARQRLMVDPQEMPPEVGVPKTIVQAGAARKVRRPRKEVSPQESLQSASQLDVPRKFGRPRRDRPVRWW